MRDPAKLIITGIFFILICHKANAQDNTLTYSQAASLARQLTLEKTDTGKFNKSLKMAWYQILKAGENKNDLDSAHNYLARSAALLKKMRSVESLGFYELVCADYYDESGRKQIAHDALEKAVGYLEKGKNMFLLGTAYEDKMYRLELIPANYAEKIKLVQLAAKAFSLTPNKRKYGDCLKLLADLRTVENNDIRALPELDSAKRLYQQARSGDWQQLYIIYARYYTRDNNTEKALECILNALRGTEDGDNSQAVYGLNFNAAILYYHLKDYKQSIIYCNKAILPAEKKKDIDFIYSVSVILATDYSKLGIPQTASVLLDKLEARYPEGDLDKQSTDHLLARLITCTYLKQYTRGQLYFNTLSQQIKNKVINTDQSLNFSLITMIGFCTHAKQFIIANKLIRDWELLASHNKSNPVTLTTLLNLRIVMDTTKKDYKAALEKMFRIKKLSDSVFTDRRTRQLKELEVQFQTERTENENILQKQRILTLTGQQKLQQIELKTAAVIRNVTLFSALCALTIAALIYRQYINGRKNNRRLERLLDENELLMKEIHHRVKNNLQIITSLLNSQSAYLDDGVALDAIMKSKGRVESISLIHQKLYRTENQSTILMSEYISDLIGYLKDGCVHGQNVAFDRSVDPIYLDVSDAVPIGLIINESVTNSIKHAFKEARGNLISISLKKVEKDVVLTVRDNGKGFKEDASKENTSFGLLLIRGLSKDLGGKLEMFNDNGMVLRLTFRATSISRAFEREMAKA